MRPLSITLHRGYVPDSPTFYGPLRTRGRVQGGVEVRESPSHLRLKRVEPACFGEDMPPGTMLWFDTSVQLEHGHLALYWAREADGGVECNCKRLYLIDGKWFAACHYYILPVEWMTNVIGWAAIVAEMQMPESWFVAGRNTQEIYDSQADEAAWRAELNGHAINQRAIRHLVEMFSIREGV